MTNRSFVSSGLLAGGLLLSCWVLPAPARAEPIPALRTVPAGLPAGIRTDLVREREALDREFKEFMADAGGFNAKPAETQTDTEFAALGERRARYIARAAAFNRKIGEATAGRQAPPAAGEDRRRLEDRITKLVSGDQERYRQQLQQLMVEADHIQVPPPPVPRQIHEGILLGLFDPQGGAAEKYAGALSPFTGKLYGADSVFATTDAKDASEAMRGLLDNHYLGAYTLNTPYGKELIRRLQGTHFDRLVAHSNGATIAEALVRRGVIQVDELNVVGGDRSMVNQPGLQELIASGNVKRVVVWINPGDVVPAGSSAALLSPFGPAGSLPVATTAQYFAELLTGNNQGGDTRVEYRFLAGKDYKGQAMRLDNFDAHSLRDAYLPNIRDWLRRQP